MILKAPTRKSKLDKGLYRMQLKDIKPEYGVEWFGDPDANVVDITFETEDGIVIKQRETFSFHKSSNLGKLVRTVLGIPKTKTIEELDTELLIGKEIVAQVDHWQNKRGNVYEKAKNFQRIEESDLEGTL